MYGLAYVLLPARYSSLQDELDRTLAPFMRGGDEDLPREQLAFHDATGELTRLHRAELRYEDGSTRWSGQHVGASFHLDHQKLKEHLAACSLASFAGTLEELEPDFDAFVRRFTRFAARDPATGQYGHWLNPLGRWDWWELGGRFNGVITGEERPAGNEQHISSGPSQGRMVLGNLARVLGDTPSTAEAEIEANVELVETLCQSIELDDAQRLPLAIVLPHGAGADAGRWFDNLEWHVIGPETRAILAAPEGADYRALAKLALRKYRDHVAAGIAYHF